MTDLELLTELIEDLARDLRPEIEPLTPEALAWNPGPQANSIGVTLWHMARGMDFLAVRILQGRPAEEEQWHTQGWREETGYDPRGVGYSGWGVVTGYTWEEVLVIPTLTSQEILEYFDQACCALSGQVRQLSHETAQQLVPNYMQGRLTHYQWIKHFYKGLQAHVGEIMAIKAMKARADRTQQEMQS
jgi:hypothetical protein